nr:lysophospholipid acyltransferase family protein [Wolbachia endosymbiont of Pentalonia nigronervosa]
MWEVLYTLVALPIIFFPSYIITFFLVYAVKVTLFFLYLLCGIKYEVKGVENIPKQPFIIASKHQSPFETFIFIILFKGAVFILKQELKWIPFIGLHLMALKMIFINRSDGVSSLRNTIRLAKTRIRENRSIIIFPEGTRTTAKYGVKYQPGVAALYSALSVPVLPIALNTGLFWPKSILSLKRNPGKAVIEILPPIYPGLNKNDFLQNLEKIIEERSSQLILQKN